MFVPNGGKKRSADPLKTGSATRTQGNFRGHHPQKEGGERTPVLERKGAYTEKGTRQLGGLEKQKGGKGAGPPIFSKGGGKKKKSAFVAD